MRLSELPVFRWHERSVHVPRVERLTETMADLAGRGDSLLDIGAGDGLLAQAIARRIGATELQGVDVHLRPNPVIPIRAYDGTTLPFDDGAFDVVTIADVLHHADDPRRVVQEALRVLKATGSLVIKDHFRFGPMSQAVLLAMDAFGNYASGVLVRGKYLSPPEWIDLVAHAGGAIDRLVWPFVVHDLPWRLVTRSEYQFIMRVRRRAAGPEPLVGANRAA